MVREMLACMMVCMVCDGEPARRGGRGALKRRDLSWAMVA